MTYSRTAARRNGKSRAAEETFDQMALGIDPAGCGCVTGVLVGQRDAITTVVKEVSQPCAKHDVVQGEVVHRELT